MSSEQAAANIREGGHKGGSRVHEIAEKVKAGTATAEEQDSYNRIKEGGQRGGSQGGSRVNEIASANRSGDATEEEQSSYQRIKEGGQKGGSATGGSSS